jgi:hypothetical protein
MGNGSKGLASVLAAVIGIIFWFMSFPPRSDGQWVFGFCLGTLLQVVGLGLGMRSRQTVAGLVGFVVSGTVLLLLALFILYGVLTCVILGWPT